MKREELSEYIKSLQFQKSFRYVNGDLGHNAITLPTNTGIVNGNWILYADIVEDYYEWINYFEAYHPDFGAVWGDYEIKIYGEKLEGIVNFIETNPPNKWDYYDI